MSCDEGLCGACAGGRKSPCPRPEVSAEVLYVTLLCIMTGLVAICVPIAWDVGEVVEGEDHFLTLTQEVSEVAISGIFYY